MAIRKGLMVTFEGQTGSGKRSHIKLLADRLKKLGKEVVTLSFPDYDSEIARLTKRVDLDPFTISLLFAADRAKHQERIKTLLEKGNIIITDRYCYSNYAYQSVKGVPLDWLMKIEENIIKPDIVILIDVPVELSFKRVKQASIEDFIKRKILDRLERNRELLGEIRKTYLYLAKTDKEAKWFVIDGSQDMSKNHERIWNIVKKEIR